MTSKEYIQFRGLAKRSAATSKGVVGTILSALKSGGEKVVNLGTKVAETGVKNSYDAARVSLPALGLITAWLAYKAASPKAVADTASDYAINAFEQESLVQSMRDLEDAKLASALKNTKRKSHDQFL